MKKQYYFFILLASCFTTYAQNAFYRTIENNHLSPNGVMEKVADHYGNHYTLSDLKIEPQKTLTLKSGTASTSTLLGCGNGYFNLYFETGSGMEIVGNPVHDARRLVLCQVFNDLSNFIYSPLTSTGNKVNIWVRNIANIPNASTGMLGLATAFYSMPNTASPNVGGIIDNEVWKTIHTGQDSYTNVANPLTSTGASSAVSGAFYHGMMAINFSNSQINWHTNLSSNAPNGLYDLYSVVLHEITHALGFSSLINADGTSKFGTGFNYYSRYDRFLMDTEESNFLLTNDNSCSMYNYGFNPALSSTLLSPNPQNSACVTDNTVCNTAVHYVGAANVPVYTPNCFEPPSSLSHFEDQCFSAAGNNGYFTMSNANGTGVTKRYLTVEERGVLCDIGYETANVYGTNAALNYKDYGGFSCSGIDVSGINDGIDANGTYTFIGEVGSVVLIHDILANDYNAVGFECLEDPFSASTFSVTSGTSTTSIAFSSSVQGLHLLRYVPINASGEQGNITYIYVFLRDWMNCAAPSACNLVSNGDFESNSILPNALSQLNYACGWTNATSASPDYFYSGGSYVGVPCNIFGSETDNGGLNAYIGMWNIESLSGLPYLESVGTKLNAPLQPNTSYQLSFNTSLAEGASASAIKFQAYLSTQPINIAWSGNLPVSDSSMLFTDTAFSTTTNGWNTVSFTFTTGANAGQSYLYLGGLSNVQFNAITPVGLPPCSTVDNNASFHWSYYYIDNISLTSLPTTALNLPASMCLNDSIIDLSSYLTIPGNSSFSGSGVVSSGAAYAFKPTQLDLGSNIITCSYTNNLGCVSHIESTIDVIACADSTPCTLSPSFGFKFDEKTCDYLFIATPYSGSGTIEYTWDFGDGTTATGLLSHHTFPANGVYVVCLTLTLKNEHGEIVCTASTCEKVEVRCIIKQVCDFTPEFSYQFDSTGCGSYTFTAAVNSNDGEALYIWNFGDGTTGTGLTQSHFYSTVGTYTVCLTVLIKDLTGKVICKKLICKKIEVDYTLNYACDAKPYFKYNASKKNCIYRFEGYYQNMDCFSVEYSWNFGDGTVSGGKNVNHIFSKDGTYTVCLSVEVKDGNGLVVCKRISCQTINVVCKGEVVYPVFPIDSKPFSIYPNPARDKITVKSAFNLGHPLQLRFIATDGKIIYELNEQKLNESLELLVDLPLNLPEGCVFVEIITDGQTLIERLIILKR